MLQHIEFEVYVNKHHIWLFEKKKHVKQSVVTIQWQNCILSIIGWWKTFFENLTFIKNNYITSYLNIYNIYIWNILIYNNQASENSEFL